MKLLIDTKIIIFLLNGNERMTDLLNGIEICVSVISEIECLAYPGISEDEKEGIKSFLQECTIVGLTNEVKEFTIDLRTKYRLKLPDSIIASSAMSSSLTFMSADHDFSKIEELDFVGFEV